MLWDSKVDTTNDEKKDWLSFMKRKAAFNMAEFQINELKKCQSQPVLQKYLRELNKEVKSEDPSIWKDELLNRNNFNIFVQIIENFSEEAESTPITIPIKERETSEEGLLHCEESASSNNRVDIDAVKLLTSIFIHAHKIDLSMLVNELDLIPILESYFERISNSKAQKCLIKLISSIIPINSKSAMEIATLFPPEQIISRSKICGFRAIASYCKALSSIEDPSFAAQAISVSSDYLSHIIQGYHKSICVFLDAIRFSIWSPELLNHLYEIGDPFPAFLYTCFESDRTALHAGRLMITIFASYSELTAPPPFDFGRIMGIIVSRLERFRSDVPSDALSISKVSHKFKELQKIVFLSLEVLTEITKIFPETSLEILDYLNNSHSFEYLSGFPLIYCVELGILLTALINSNHSGVEQIPDRIFEIMNDLLESDGEEALCALNFFHSIVLYYSSSGKNDLIIQIVGSSLDLIQYHQDSSNSIIGSVAASIIKMLQVSKF